MPPSFEDKMCIDFNPSPISPVPMTKNVIPSFQHEPFSACTLQLGDPAGNSSEQQQFGQRTVSRDDKSPRLIFRGPPLSIPCEPNFHPYNRTDLDGSPAILAIPKGFSSPSSSHSVSSSTSTSSSRRLFPCANKIFPWLFLGSRQDANDIAFLKRHDIRFILNVSRQQDVLPPLDPRSQSDNPLQTIEFFFLPMRDTLDESLTQDNKLDVALAFIHKARRANQNLLVHCAYGISRSAAIVIAFIMTAYNVPYESALTYVKARRPHIQPNLNFTAQLRKLHDKDSPALDVDALVRPELEQL